MKIFNEKTNENISKNNRTFNNTQGHFNTSFIMLPNFVPL